MALIVQKYGGTSVGDLDRIARVAQRVGRAKSDGNSLIVVVSAMSGETDKLIEMAHKLNDFPPDREMDLLMSSGERVTAALLAIALTDLGIPAISFTGRQIGLTTDSVHMKARIRRITGERLREAVAEGKVAVVAGFQGMDETSGSVTTLGRGGTDTSAVAIAVAMKADLCEIYTDVDGVYTTDPRIVPNARRLDNVSFEEMLEMASLGAKVLQTRSVEFGMKYNMPIHVKSTFTEGKGTLVSKESSEMEEVVVSAVTYDRNQAKITVTGVPDRPGIAARIFSVIADHEINVDMIIQNVSEGRSTDISFTAPKTEMNRAVNALQPLIKELDADHIATDEDIAKISVIGVGMRSHSGVAAKTFSSLADAGINIMMISTSEIKISCVIEAQEVDRAIRILHDAFSLALPPDQR